ncbi:ABC transporter permease [Humibacter ginsenosidimutans]|uniref:ABC transporter permease n=1 Tax=Humibacter ginsenosidimutans TaxID=2599293 RepID=A0A5B8M9S4_9MICO|nr:ABC transporter permease [Humibacter ginsenosidimutans]QDZ16392.1 ABC transporter permease [Humibacter ginsenosidimutans]
MTTTADHTIPDASPIVLEKTVVRSYKTPILLSVVAALSIVLYVVFRRGGDTTFTFAGGRIAASLPNVVLPTTLTCVILTIVLVVMAALSWWLVSRFASVPLWFSGVFAFLFVLAFLTWAAGANALPLPITGLLLGTVSLSVPYIFGALGGVISERSGVVNIAIEGQLLGGAFLAAVVSSMTRSLTLGLIAAVVAGVLVSFLLAAFAIKYYVDQVIVGVVINVLVLGLTNFLYSQVLTKDPSMTKLLNSPPLLPALPIPGLSAIPVIGPVLFDQSIIVYLMYIAVAAVYIGLFHTRWGLRLRSVGEHPQAADTVGINVTGTRFWNVSLAGAIVGLGGAYFTLGSVGSFSEDMTGGQGYIALAAVIFGRWDPIRATLAALLFGFASNLQYTLAAVGSPVPSEFLLMLPYVVTILAVAGFVGYVRSPAADGKPYIKS